jgi:glucose/arabinose dehydrogenase/mono/diheme cytochrome c family protein
MFAGLTFEKPIRLRSVPVESDTWLVALAQGVVERVHGNDVKRVLDFSARVELGQQWGLQDVALHPAFPRDRRLFVAYLSRDLESIVSFFVAAEDGSVFDAASETILLREAQSDPWHGVGALEFGNDGYLYVSWGYGADRSQDLEHIGGKLLRIDVDRRENGKPYGIPPTNPYLGVNARPEIYAIGLRNPWRFGIDRETGEIWAGDVGDRHFEEINRIEPGRNYGWNSWEGSDCVLAGSCKNEGFTFPFAVHPHNEFCAITGGTVYRGRALPALAGKYVYANYCTGTIWALVREGEQAGRREVIAYAGASVGSFAEDGDGELYIVHTNDDDIDGRDPLDGFQVRKLVPNSTRVAPRTSSENLAESLAASGCVNRRGFRYPPRLMLAYEINHPPWEDGATIRRYVTRHASVAVPGDRLPLFAPEKSVFMKTYEVAGRPIETQVLRRRLDGGWDALDFEWNDAGTDAAFLQRAKTKQLPGGERWTYPGAEGCAACHNAASEVLLGFRLSQLDLASDGAAKLRRLEQRGVIQWREGDAKTARIPTIADKDASLDARARAYLQVNCSHCHRPAGQAGEARMDLRMEIPLSEARICGEAPTGSWPGHEDALLLAPGEPKRSLISLRMHAVDTSAMPPQRHVVDDAGADLIDAWIRSVEGCP